MISTNSTEPPVDVRIYAYGRASTARQKNSLDVQKHQAETAIATPDDSGEQREQFADRVNRGDLSGQFAGFYCDSISTRKKPLFEREQFRILWGQLRKGDHLLITAFDRVCRSLSEMARFTEALIEKGVLLHVLRFSGKELDLTSAQGELMVGILAVSARFEQRMLSERVKETVRYLKAQGLPYHNGAIYGQRRVFSAPDRYGRRRIVKRVDDEDEMALIRQIHTRHSHGETLTSILRDFKRRQEHTAEGNTWSYARVQRAYDWYVKRLAEASEREERA
ncbi:hypothetical protein LCGC14_1621230 [marine sediment metagenome]|uniref:Resolvase/invertase-type recombinase catalytic domain-containing protein n=1 Tax=marine sediment metagenome TaxID=412755 RepID=A0A0F9L5C0_9ZZZZ